MFLRALWRFGGRGENEIGKGGYLGTISRTVYSVCWCRSRQCRRRHSDYTDQTQTSRLCYLVSLERSNCRKTEGPYLELNRASKVKDQYLHLHLQYFKYSSTAYTHVANRHFYESREPIPKVPQHHDRSPYPLLVSAQACGIGSSRREPKMQGARTV